MLQNLEISAVLMGHLACKETLHFFFFYYPLDCMTPLGMENHQIPDSSITASSEVSVIDSKTTERLRFEIKKMKSLTACRSYKYYLMNLSQS